MCRKIIFGEDVFVSVRFVFCNNSLLFVLREAKLFFLRKVVCFVLEVIIEMRVLCFFSFF